MAHLSNVYVHFSHTVDEQIDNFTLQKLMPNVVKFHLQCALDAFSNENGLRYLPHPKTYYPHVTTALLQQFIEVCNNSRIVDLVTLPHFEYYLKDILTEPENSRIMLRLLYFTLFTCEMTLQEHNISTASEMFLVSESKAKEDEFKQRFSSITYLFHTTERRSLYSICRNGIQSMSNEPSFKVNGTGYGYGIYLSERPHAVSGDVVLCYAVKNAANYHRGGCYVVPSNTDLCLRAIVLDLQLYPTYGKEIIELVKEKDFVKIVAKPIEPIRQTQHNEEIKTCNIL